MKVKDIVFTTFGVVGGLVSAFLGDYTMSLRLLFILMATDYILGVLSGFLLKSTKTQSGGLSSRAGFKGLLKKLMIVTFVGLGHNLDLTLNTHMIREMVVIGYSANELISIIEHAGVIGVPVPPVFNKVIDILNEQAGGELWGQEQN